MSEPIVAEDEFDLPDLRVRIRAKAFSHWAEFEVFLTEVENGVIFILSEEGWKRSIEGVSPTVLGHVDYAGCSNWNAPNGPIHFCERERLVELGKVMAMCWDYAGIRCNGSNEQRPDYDSPMWDVLNIPDEDRW